MKQKKRDKTPVVSILLNEQSQRKWNFIYKYHRYYRQARNFKKEECSNERMRNNREVFY